MPCPTRDTPALSEALVAWALEERLDTVVTLSPFTGPLADEIPKIGAAFADRGVRLNLLRRPEEVVVMNRATGGFFGFWEKVRERG
jgi:hypothetical protein